MSEKKSGDHNIADLRKKLFETLAAVKSGTLELDRARLVNEIGKTLIDSAKVEVDFIRATDGSGSEFLGNAAKEEAPLKPMGISSVFQHRIAG